MSYKSRIGADAINSPSGALYVNGLKIGATTTQASGFIRVLNNPSSSFTVTIGTRTETITPGLDTGATATAIKTAFDVVSSTKNRTEAAISVSGNKVTLTAHQLGASGNDIALATGSADLELSGSTLGGGGASLEGAESIGSMTLEEADKAAASGFLDVEARPVSGSDTVVVTVGSNTVTVPSSDATLTAVAATADIVFTDKPNETTTITLTDAASTSATFEIDADANGVTGGNIAVDGIVAAGGGAAGTAIDLAAKINGSSLAMTASNPSSGTLRITQNSTGSAGNTSISTSGASWATATSSLPARLINGIDGAVAATATFTFSDKPNEESTITIIDANRLTVTFEVDNEADGVASGNTALDGISGAGGGATGTAADLVAKVNASSLAITATNPSTGVVLLTQDNKGTAGNTTLTVNDSSHWGTVTSVAVPSAFTGGTGQTGHTLAEFVHQVQEKVNNNQANIIGDTFAGIKFVQTPDEGDQIKLNIPSAVGGAGADILINFEYYDGTPTSASANQITFAFTSGESLATTAARLRDVINGVGSSHSGYYSYGSGSGDTTTGVAGVQAFDGDTTGALDLYIDESGTGGNSAVFQCVTGVGRISGIGTSQTFSGGLASLLDVSAADDGVQRVTLTARTKGSAGNSISVSTSASTYINVEALSGGSDGRGFTQTADTMTFGGTEFVTSGTSSENVDIRSIAGDLDIQGGRFANGSKAVGTYKLLTNPTSSFTLTVNGVAHSITPGASGARTLKTAADAINASAAGDVVTASSTSDTLTLTAVRSGTRGNEIAFSSNSKKVVAQNNGKLAGGSTLFEKMTLRGEDAAQATAKILVLADSATTITFGGGGNSVPIAMPARGSVAQFANDLAAEINNQKAGLLANSAAQGVVINSPTGGGSERYIITIPATAGGSGSSITVNFLATLTGSPSSNVVEVKCAGGASDATVADRVKLAINGSGGDANIDYGSGSGDTTNGIQGLTATDGIATNMLDLHVTVAGQAGKFATFVPSATTVSPVASSQSFTGAGDPLCTAVSDGVDTVTCTAASYMVGIAGNAITITSSDTARVAATGFTGGTSAPTLTDTTRNSILLHTTPVNRTTPAPGSYAVKSNNEILLPGLPRIYQFNLDYQDFNVASQTATIDLYVPPYYKFAGLGHVIENVFVYRKTAFEGSGGITTVNVEVGVDNVIESSTDKDALILANDLSSSGDTVIGAVAADKGTLFTTDNTALIMPGTTYEKVTVTLDAGSGKTCNNLTAGEFQVIIRYWDFPIVY